MVEMYSDTLCSFGCEDCTGVVFEQSLFLHGLLTKTSLRNAKNFVFKSLKICLKNVWKIL